MSGAFNVAWNVAKMPFVPGSVRPSIVPESGEMLYEGDFYDPIDEKNRTITITPPTKKPKEQETGGLGRAMRTMAGIPTLPTGVEAHMDLNEDEMREPELLFGEEQRIPFGLVQALSSSHYPSLDRLFVPEHLRRRGIGAGMVDALDEWGKKYSDHNEKWSIRPDSDNMQTEDMFRLWHSRGHMPATVQPYNPGDTIGDDQYWAARWHDWGGPSWDEKGPNKQPFDEGWKQAQYYGHMELVADQEEEEMWRNCQKKREEVEEKYGKSMEELLEDWQNPLPADEMHEDGYTCCECWEGHPWYDLDTSMGHPDDGSQLHRHLAYGTKRYPGTWAKRKINQEIVQHKQRNRGWI